MLRGEGWQGVSTHQIVDSISEKCVCILAFTMSLCVQVCFPGEKASVVAWSDSGVHIGFCDANSRPGKIYTRDTYMHVYIQTVTVLIRTYMHPYIAGRHLHLRVTVVPYTLSPTQACTRSFCDCATDSLEQCVCKNHFFRLVT